MYNSYLIREDVRALHARIVWCFRIGLIVMAIGGPLLFVVIVRTNGSASNKFHQRHQEMCLRNNGTEAWCQESWELLRDMTGYYKNPDVWHLVACVICLWVLFLGLVAFVWTSVPRSIGALFVTANWVVMHMVYGMIYNEPPEETDEKESA